MEKIVTSHMQKAYIILSSKLQKAKLLSVIFSGFVAMLDGKKH